MTCFIEVKCHRCKQPFFKKNGFNRKGIQRYLCCNEPCPTKSLMLEYCYQACIPEIKEKSLIWQPMAAVYGIQRFYTDDWGAYERNLDQEKHSVGKRNTQKIERKNLNLRAWIKRLTRKTIYFSNLEIIHDIIIGLLINRIEFGIDIHAQTHI